MENKTFYALLARGIDSQIASKMVENNYTINKLKLLKLNELIKLGLNKKQADNLLKETRPPIPIETIINLLFKSKSTCCICREHSNPIIIHHILSWEKIRDHSEKNLVVLCLNDHAEAHTDRRISHNLTPELIRELKIKWEKEVKNSDAKAILGLTDVYARWDYINHQRLFEMVETMKIKTKDNIYFRELINLGIINKFGLINDHLSWKNQNPPTFYLYDFGGATMLYLYTKSLLEQVISRLAIVDIIGRWNKTEINALVKPGIFISCQGAFYFKSSKNNEGRNQIRQCYRQSNNIKINFQIDAWEATSSSSKNDSLCGHKVITCICFVRDILERDGILTINASCLSIGSDFRRIIKPIIPKIAYKLEID